MFVHNTAYHASIGCTLTFLLHGRQPHSQLDLRFDNKLLQTLETRYEFTSTLQDKMNEVFSLARDATITTYNKYRHFYDRKASAAPLKNYSFCLLLNPKLSNTNDHMGKSLTKWLPLYRVESVLTNSNYIVRKVGTYYTQCVHRIRLRPITPQYTVDDLDNVNQSNFVPDPSTRLVSEPALFDQALPDLLTDRTFKTADEVEDTPAVVFHYVPRRVPPAPPPAPPAPPAPQALLVPPPGLPQPLHALPQSEVPPNRDFPHVEYHVDLPPVIYQARLDTSTVPLQDQHHHSFFVSSSSGTPCSSVNMPHFSFFPTPETTYTSDDVFTVAQPTSGIVTTITSSTPYPPLMHSTPISSHTSLSYFPSPSGLTQKPMPTLDSESLGLDSQTSRRISIYTPGHESSSSSSSSSFSGFSDTLVNRARAIASPTSTTPRSNVTPLFDRYNTPTYSSHPNAKPYYIRPPSSRIPRPTTPTPTTLPFTVINPLLLLFHKELRYTAHQPLL